VEAAGGCRARACKNYRKAVASLSCTAAHAYGDRVIGVVLPAAAIAHYCAGNEGCPDKKIPHPGRRAPTVVERFGRSRPVAGSETPVEQAQAAVTGE
jgi:hypothetical protein